MYSISPEQRLEKMDMLFLKQHMNQIQSMPGIKEFKSMEWIETLERLKQIKSKVENFRHKDQELESEISFETIELKKMINKFFI